MPTRKEVIKFFIGCAVFIIAAVIILLNVISFEKELEIELDGIKFNRHSVTETEMVSISFWGTYEDYLIEWWNQDSFEGDFYLSDLPEYEWSLDEDSFSGSKELYGYKWIPVSTDFRGETSYVTVYGRMIFEDDLSRLVIMSGDGVDNSLYNEYYYDDIFYVFPSEDVNEAVDIANEWTFYQIGAE